MMGNIPQPLSNEEIMNLFKEYKNGNIESRDIIITHNIRLVDYIINKYFRKTPFDIEDLESTGLVALIKAVDNFDIDKNIKFATFATRVIYNEILMLLRKRKGNEDVSLEEPIYTGKDGEELVLGDTISDENSNFAEIFDNEETLKLVREFVLNMPDSKAKQCITLYFGFDCKEHTQKQIEDILGVNQSYVSRLLRKAIKTIGNELKEIGIINRVGRVKKDKEISSSELPSHIYSMGQTVNNSESFNTTKRQVINIPDSKTKNINYENLATEKAIESITIGDKEKIMNTIKEEDVKGNMIDVDELLKDNVEYKAVKDFILSEPDCTEKQVIMMYLSFNGKIYSQKEIAEKFCYSPSHISRMISQMSKKIDEKLRQNDIKDKDGCYITVSAFKQLLNNQKHRAVPGKGKLLTIYEQLHLSDKTLINSVINRLSKEEKRLFDRRNGNDLDNPILSSDWTHEDGKKYNGILISKMKKILINIQNSISNEKQETINEEKELTYEQNITGLTTDLPKEEKKEIIPATDDCIGKMNIYLLDTILENMPRQEAFVVSLSLGLLPNGKIYSTDEIANFLNIDRVEVIEIVKNALILYKQSLNNFIDGLMGEDKSITK